MVAALACLPLPPAAALGDTGKLERIQSQLRDACANAAPCHAGDEAIGLLSNRVGFMTESFP